MAEAAGLPLGITRPASADQQPESPLSCGGSRRATESGRLIGVSRETDCRSSGSWCAGARAPGWRAPERLGTRCSAGAGLGAPGLVELTCSRSAAWRLRAGQGRVAQAAPPLPSALSASRSADECALPIPRRGTSDLACWCLCGQLCSGIPELADWVALRVSLF